MVAATTRMIRYNKRTECSETAYQVKVATAGMLMCHACYSMSLIGSFTIPIFNFGIQVTNMIAQKLKIGQSTQHELFNKVHLEKLPNSFKFSSHTYFCAWTIWPSYPTGVAVLPHGVGQDGFFATFCEIVHLILV